MQALVGMQTCDVTRGCHHHTKPNRALPNHNLVLAIKRKQLISARPSSSSSLTTSGTTKTTATTFNEDYGTSLSFSSLVFHSGIAPLCSSTCPPLTPQRKLLPKRKRKRLMALYDLLSRFSYGIAPKIKTERALRVQSQKSMGF